MQLGFALEHEAKEKNDRLIRVSISKSDHDWFELKLLYKLNEETVDLGNRIDLNSNRKTVSIDNKRISIPECIIQNSEKLVQSEDGLKISSSNFWTVV